MEVFSPPHLTPPPHLYYPCAVTTKISTLTTVVEIRVTRNMGILADKTCQKNLSVSLVLFNRFLVSLEGFDLELGLSCVVFFHVLAVIVL